MKKKLLYGLIFCVGLLLPTMSAHALRPYEMINRKECEKIELATAKVDGSLEKVECFEDYNTAKIKMYEIKDNDDLVIIENGVVIDTKYGIIDYDQDFTNASTKYVRIYKNKDDKAASYMTYIRTASGYYADDAVLLDYDYATKRAKIKVAGVVGWIDKYDNTAVLYDIVPYVWTKSLQFYSVTQDRIIHNFPKNIYGQGGKTSLALDLKPSMLEVGNYYSYDGHYFYTDVKVMINDYKNNTYDNSLNKDKPYYNYYQYLSYRTKTNYNADNINDYINFRTGNNKKSKLYNSGQDFINTQEKYGINAMLMLIVGINESSSGLSTISQDKNNLFGLGAVDADPYNSAHSFNTVGDCIDTYGYKWLSYGYVQPGDWRFEGANLGDKGEGITVHYASDPFWGEKAANYYFLMDSRYGFQDRNNYLLAVNTVESVHPKKSVNGQEIANYFNYDNINSSVVVLETIKANDGTIWYKIQSDPNLNDKLDYIGSSTDPIHYNWNSQVYVEASKYLLISNPDDYDPKNVKNEEPKTEPTPESKPVEEDKPKYKEISIIVSDAKYKYNDGIISGINIGSNVSNIKDSLIKQGAKSVVIKGANGDIKNTDILVTGDKIEITTDKTEVVEVVIYGDINGDGEISASDYVKIKNHIMGIQLLNGVYGIAADYNNDNSVSASDYVKIKNYIMGK